MRNKQIPASPIRSACFVASLLMLAGTNAWGGAPQDSKQADDDSDLVTVRGQFVNPDSPVRDFDWTTIKASLVQDITLQQPTLPADWAERSPENRRQWVAKFRASEEGQQMIAANREVIANRNIVEFEVSSDGEFVAYDVPVGRYTLQAAAQQVADGKTWILQAFGQIDVGDVDVLELAKMPVETVRLLKPDEQAPDISGQTVDGQAASLQALQGNWVLLNFAVLGNPGFVPTCQAIAAASRTDEAAGQLKILTVAVDEDLDVVKQFIADQSIDWDCIALGRWDTSVLNRYGVSRVPSLWLVNPEGQIVLTGQQFQFELAQAERSISELVIDAIAGQLELSERTAQKPAAEPDQ